MKGFEYYLKLDEFYQYRRDNGMEIEAVMDLAPHEISEDCPDNIATQLIGFMDYVDDHMFESMDYANRSQMLLELVEFLDD